MSTEHTAGGPAVSPALAPDAADLHDLPAHGRRTPPFDNAELAAHSAAEAIRSLDLAIERYRTAYAHGAHITVSDSLVMSHLSVVPDQQLTPRELSDRLTMSSGTLTTVIDRLELAGYARRVPNPSDGRSVLVRLTAEGGESLDAHRGPLLGAIEAAVPIPDRVVFAARIAQIATDMEAAAARLANG